MRGRFEDIATFVRVCKAGSFSAASREIGCTPSAVSKTIARLEERIGVPLISRTTHTLALTDAGQAFFDRCSKSLSDMDDAAAFVTQFRTAPYGLLRVKVPQGFGRLHIAPFIPDFIAKYPDVQLDLRFGRLEQGFVEERLDVLVASADPSNADLIVRPIVAIERVTCAAPDYISRSGRPSCPEDLKKYNCLIFDDSDSVDQEWTYYENGIIKRVQITGNFRTDNTDAMRTAVIRGVGIAHIPTFIVGSELSSGRLIELFREGSRNQRSRPSMKVYFSRSKRRLPKIRAFLDFLFQCIRTF